MEDNIIIEDIEFKEELYRKNIDNSCFICFNKHVINENFNECNK